MEERPPIGALLREARLRQDLEIAECAAATRIRERYLVAIEDGRYESLPDPAYVNGFVRAYAVHLGVTIDEPVIPVARDHQIGAAPRPRTGAAPQSTPPVRVTPRGIRGMRRTPWWRRPGGVAVLAVIIVIAVVVMAAAGVVSLPG